MNWIIPDWPAPPNVHAAATTRTGGVSTGPYASLNLGAHVGDDPEAVRENRRRVRNVLGLTHEPAWLNQVHGRNVVAASAYPEPPAADASFALAPGPACVVMTADCLPVVFCDEAGTRVAAAHAGWRGLADGVLEATVAALQTSPSRLLAWLGPAIEPAAFEVGPEVRERFMQADEAAAVAFAPNERGRWQADIYTLARLALRRIGITRIYGGEFACFADRERFFSYRRDTQTGRMATLIWLS
jgi:YfiH family protein